jgi:hypothetical protein
MASTGLGALKALGVRLEIVRHDGCPKRNLIPCVDNSIGELLLTEEDVDVGFFLANSNGLNGWYDLYLLLVVVGHKLI